MSLVERNSFSKRDIVEVALHDVMFKILQPMSGKTKSIVIKISVM